MLSVIFDNSLDGDLITPIHAAFTRFGIAASTWNETAVIPVGTHAVATCPQRLELLEHLISNNAQPPLLVVLGTRFSIEQTRGFLKRGVAAVIEANPDQPVPAAIAVLAAATGHVVAAPPRHIAEMATRLEEPPRALTLDEQQLLALAATRSIEAAGRCIGLSRRQTQRRYKRICDDLQLDSHLHAAVAAARWGLVDRGPD